MKFLNCFKLFSIEENSWNSENCYEISSILKQNIDSNSSANLNFSISSKNTTNLISSSEEYFLYLKIVF